MNAHGCHRGPPSGRVSGGTSAAGRWCARRRSGGRPAPSRAGCRGGTLPQSWRNRMSAEWIQGTGSISSDGRLGKVEAALSVRVEAKAWLPAVRPLDPAEPPGWQPVICGVPVGLMPLCTPLTWPDGPSTTSPTILARAGRRSRPHLATLEQLAADGLRPRHALRPDGYQIGPRHLPGNQFRSTGPRWNSDADDIAHHPRPAACRWRGRTRRTSLTTVIRYCRCTGVTTPDRATRPMPGCPSRRSTRGSGLGRQRGT
jgi:hypothetical protein